MPKQIEILKHHPDIFRKCRSCVFAVLQVHSFQFVLADANAAAVKLQPVQASQQRRFAATRRADDDGQFGHGNIKADASERRSFAMTVSWKSRFCKLLTEIIVLTSTNPFPFALPKLIAEQILLNLAGRRSRQRVNEADGFRAFEMRKVVPAKRDDVVFRRSLAWFENDQRGWNFAPSFVGNGDAGGFQHFRMFVEHAFDFDGRDVFAAGNNQVFFAVYDFDHAFGVHRSHIAGVKPSVNDHCVGGFRLKPVTFHDHVAAGDDFADGLIVRRNVVARFIHHASFNAQHRVAGARLDAVLFFLRPVAHVRFDFADGQERRSFSESPASRPVAQSP